jgi:hypothetical protein
VHTCHFYISTCAPFVDLNNLSDCKSGFEELAFSLSLHFQAYVSLYTPIYLIECNRPSVPIIYTTFSNGSLGSRIDEERSEMR